MKERCGSWYGRNAGTQGGKDGVLRSDMTEDSGRTVCSTGGIRYRHRQKYRNKPS